jgi:phosphoribosylformylglycinamidine (FGAM) synthase-like enzyme
MALAGNVGFTFDVSGGAGFWFGEDQARYVVATRQPELLEKKAAAAGVSLTILGKTGGKGLAIKEASALDLATLRAAHENWLPGFMAD